MLSVASSMPIQVSARMDGKITVMIPEQKIEHHLKTSGVVQDHLRYRKDVAHADLPAVIAEPAGVFGTLTRMGPAHLERLQIVAAIASTTSEQRAHISWALKNRLQSMHSLRHVALVLDEEATVHVRKHDRAPQRMLHFYGRALLSPQHPMNGP
jgi:hypothetical protein